MGIDEEICNTGLSLGLGSFESSGSTTTHKIQVDDDQLHHQRNKKSELMFPSLSLALSSEVVLTNQGSPPIIDDIEAAKLKRQVSSLSVLSSLSNSTSVKRERDILVVSGEEEVDLQYLSSSKIISNISSHDQDQDDDQEYFGPRKKLRLSKDQSFVLEESFKEHSTLNPKQKQVLANRLNLLPRQVEVWFQNRRARTKLKQTEVEFEMIKKYSEALTEENRRLKKEVQDLKALIKSTTPTAAAAYIYTSTNITLCPCCQRISPATTTSTTTTRETNSSRSQYFSSSKPQFYATPHSSAPSYSTTLQTN